MKPLIFVVAGSSRAQLERLTQLLVTAFPGSTIYQHPDLLRVPHDTLNNRVDAVFLEAEAGKQHILDLIQMLHKQKPDLPVFMISNASHLFENDIEKYVTGCFVLPDGEQQLLDAVCLSKGKRIHPQNRTPESIKP